MVMKSSSLRRVLATAIGFVCVTAMMVGTAVQTSAADAELSTAFFKLTPGRQRSYVIYLNAAKKTETRVARILACRERILAGKGALERL